MFSCRTIMKMLSKSATCVQARTNKVLPYRRPIKVFSKSDYETYLRNKMKKKPKKVLKVPKVSAEAVLKAAAASKKSEEESEVDSDLQQLKYKKLRDLPGNVVSRMLYDIGHAKKRPNPHLCLLSNPQLINNALNAGSFVKNIYFTRLDDLKVFPINSLKSVHLTHVPNRFLNTLPKSCREGLFAVASTQNEKLRKTILHRRRMEDRKLKLKLLQMTLICETIKNKEDMGKVIKFAEEFGCLQVYVMSGCVDVWDAEVIRVAEGAHFKLPIIWDDVSWDNLIKSGNNFYAVHSNRAGVGLKDFVGSETLKSYEDSSRIFDLLKSESSLETLSKSEETDFYMPAIQGNHVNFRDSGMLLLGNFTNEAFYFAAQNKFSNSWVLSIPKDSSKNASDQMKFIFNEVEKIK